MCHSLWFRILIQVGNIVLVLVCVKSNTNEIQKYHQTKNDGLPKGNREESKMNESENHKSDCHSVERRAKIWIIIEVFSINLVLILPGSASSRSSFFLCLHTDEAALIRTMMMNICNCIHLNFFYWIWFVFYLIWFGSTVILEWTLGTFMCKAVSYTQGVSVSASVNTLVAISIERCVTISYPYVLITLRYDPILWLFQSSFSISIKYSSISSSSWEQAAQVCSNDYMGFRAGNKLTVAVRVSTQTAGQ